MDQNKRVGTQYWQLTKTIDEIQAWETQVDKHRLSSALSQYGLRVKIHIDQVRVWQDQELCEMPAVLKKRHMNAIISLGEIWHTKKVKTALQQIHASLCLLCFAQ